MATGGPVAAMCVQDVDAQGVLQFTLVHAVCCALHRHTIRVIHPTQYSKLTTHYGYRCIGQRPLQPSQINPGNFCSDYFCEAVLNRLVNILSRLACPVSILLQVWLVPSQPVLSFGMNERFQGPMYTSLILSRAKVHSVKAEQPSRV